MTDPSDSLGVIVTNARAARELAWLRAHVGDMRVRDAVGSLPGARRAFPLNIARALGITLPTYLAQEPVKPEFVRARIAALKKMLGR